MGILAQAIAPNISTDSFARIALAAKSHTSLSAAAKDYKNPFAHLISFLAEKLGFDDPYQSKDKAMEFFTQKIKAACPTSSATSNNGLRETMTFSLADKEGQSRDFKIKEYYNRKNGDYGIALVEILPSSTYETDAIYTRSGVTLQDFIASQD